LGLISGTKIELVAKQCNEHSKWIVILGAAGAVGQFSVQVAKLCGFKVLASCSPKNGEFVKSIGADETFDYKIPLEEQIKEVGRVTGGKFSKVYDCSAMATETGMAALGTSIDTEPRIFATTNDW
jgi:NADPH:quinone reductase-like Zn-dependent oxidoreductase